MTRALTDREKRVIRGGAVLAVLYLAVFFGAKGYRWLEDQRAAYVDLAVEARKVGLAINAERAKARRFEHLRQATNLDPRTLREEEMVGDARSAIAKTAQACSVAILSSREMPGGGGGGREAASMQLEGSGATPALLAFLHGLRKIGCPLLIDRLTVQTAGMKPGQVRFSLTAVILSYTAWKKEATGA